MLSKGREKIFWAQVDKGTRRECWVWSSGRTTAGYGEFCTGGRTLYAHRVSWELANKRKVPEGLFVLHSCDNPPCVNPAHLRAGTQKDNARDAVERGRHRCPVGETHPRAKLTRGDVVKIRRLLSQGVSQRRIAELFSHRKISHKTVTEINKGRTWKHVK